jgi:GNAT superfamily N-acetyltransferase
MALGKLLRAAFGAFASRTNSAVTEERNTTAEDSPISIVKVDNATFLADDLFRRSFAQPPPRTPVHYVAFAQRAPSTFEVVGYYHVDHRREYALVGGLCVDTRYRNRGLGEQFSRIAFDDAGDRKAFFCYLGNPTSIRIAQRIGYEPTPHQYLMVRWFQSLLEEEKQRLIAEVAVIGPF